MAAKTGVRASRGGGSKTVVFGLVLGFLRTWRGKRASLEALSEDLSKVGVTISGSALHRFETDGRIPDAIVIDGLARIYRISRERLLDVLVADVQGRALSGAEEIARDLLRHTGEIKTNLLTKEGADVVLSATDARLLAERLDEVEAYADELQTALADIAESADRTARLASFAVDRKQARSTQAAKTSDGRHD